RPFLSSPAPRAADDIQAPDTYRRVCMRPVPRETSGMFKFLGRFTVAHAGKICTAWLLGGLLLTFLAPSWDAQSQDDDIRFLPERCDSVRGYNLLAQAFPHDVFASRVLFALERPDRRLSDADFALADQLAADLMRLGQQD